MSEIANPVALTALVICSKPRIFALIIGINQYESQDFPKLRGAVADATYVWDLLVSHYQVPQDQIKLLLDKDASRSNIISAFGDLSTDPRIRLGDPILIYFAGHGSQIHPPIWWECGGQGSKIQVIVPQDYSSKPGHEISAISDRTIGLLIDEIAHKKGDNITVMFDCCYAASGTRCDRIRSVDLDSSIHPHALDVHSRVNSAPPSGLTSHILLAACCPSEFAREINGQGAFTTELLKVLRANPPDELRYQDILHKINSIDGQNPQCEGLHQDRYLFNSRVSSPAPISYVPRHDPDFNAIIIDAGIAHDVTYGAEFAFYVVQESNSRGKPFGTFVVDKATPFYSMMKPAGGLAIPALPLPIGLVAFQTKLGQGTTLRLYVRDSPDPLIPPSHRDLILRACGNDLHHIQFVDSGDQAHLELTVQRDRVVITVRDTRATQHGQYQLPTRIVTWNELGRFLSMVQTFYRELDRCGVDTDVIESIGLQFYKLQETACLVPSGADLFHDGVIHLAVEDGCSYGVKLTNNGPYDLYPTLLYFDGSDPTHIRTYYQPSSPGNFLLDSPLKKNGGTLTIGYGSGGMPSFSYSLSGNISVEFLKLSVSTRPLNSSSAFPECALWGTITIPVIQHPLRPRYGLSPRGRKDPNLHKAFPSNGLNVIRRTMTA